MKFNLQITKSSQKIVFKRLLLMSGEIQRQVAEEVDKATKAIRTEARARAPRDTGRLARSISIKKLNDGLTGVVYTKASRAGSSSGVGYAHLVEFGSGAFYSPPKGVGKRGGGGPYTPASRGMLGAWSERKNLPAFPVARGIGMRGGVKGRPFLFPAFEGEKKSFQRGLRRAIWNRGVLKFARRRAA